MSEQLSYESMSYEEFGRAFFEVAVSEDRVADAIGSIAGEAFEIGPIAQGPGKLVKATARVQVKHPIVAREVGERIEFAIRIPLEIDMTLDLRIDRPRFMVFGEIKLRATAVAAKPLLLILDVTPPKSSDIAIHVTSSSIRAELVRIVGNVDGEIRRFVARHVADEISSPAAKKAQVIDVGTLIASAWTGV
jgi:hypothetical protein